MNRSAMTRFISWDQHWVRRFNRGSRYRSLRLIFEQVSRLGDGAFWYALMLVMWLIDIGTVRPVLHMALAGLAGTLVYKWLKRSASRPRPFHRDQEIVLSIAPLDRYSFPSGHTLHAVIFTYVAVSYFPMLGWLLIPFSFLVAVSRLVLGLHYPSDVVAGLLIGGGIAAVSLQVVAP